MQRYFQKAKLSFVTFLVCYSAQALMWVAPEGDDECAGVAERVEGLKLDYPNAFYGPGVKLHGDSPWRYLSVIPSRYLDLLFNEYGLRIELLEETWLDQKVQKKGLEPGKTETETIKIGARTRGVTTFKGDDPKPKSMWLRPPLSEVGRYYGLIHEVGHVIDLWLWSVKKTDYERPFDVLYGRYKIDKSASWMVRKQEQELTPELFDSYYCSKITRTKLRLNYSDAYSFAKRFLLPPLNLATSELVQGAEPRENP